MTVYDGFVPPDVVLYPHPTDTFTTTVGQTFYVEPEMVGAPGARLLAIKHYRPVAQTTTPYGAVWELGNPGTPIAAVAFATEAVTGWRYAYLPSPVDLDAAKAYVVGTWTNGNYACWGYGPGYGGTSQGRKYYWTQYGVNRADGGYDTVNGPGYTGTNDGPLGAFGYNFGPFNPTVGVAMQGHFIYPPGSPGGLQFPAVQPTTDTGEYRVGDLYGSDVVIETVNTVTAPVTSSGPLAGIVDDFTTYSGWNLVSGTTPTVSGGALVVPANTEIERTTRGSLRDGAVTIGLVDVNLTNADRGPDIVTPGAQTVISLRGHGPVAPVLIEIVIYRDFINSLTGIAFDHRNYGKFKNVGNAYTYAQTRDRYLRIVEASGLLMLDAAPTPTGPWYTMLEDAHPFRPDQLSALAIRVRHQGSRAAGPIKVDALNTPPVDDTLPVPSRATLDAMGATTAVVADTWHGRDVPCAVVDEGTTAAVRARIGATLLGRYIAPGASNPALSNWRPWSTKEINLRPAGGGVSSGNYHGCLVAGCLVPPGGRFYDVLIPQFDGAAPFSTMAAGMKWAADQGAKVINLSFGGSSDSALFVDMFTYLAAKGAVAFCSAGNSGTNGLEYPAAYAASYPLVHAVGALNEAMTARAVYSNYGAGLTGMAPGTWGRGRTPNGKPRTWSGTSEASPNAGQLAVRALSDEQFSPIQVSGALKATRRTLPGVPAVEQGGGAYDFAAATVYLAAQVTFAADAVGGTRRFPVASGQTPPVSTFNGMAQDIDNLGVSVNVRRTATTALPANVDTVVAWHAMGYRTRLGMWVASAPTAVRIVESGRYLLVAQVRFGLTGGSSAGTRGAKLCRNGTTEVLVSESGALPGVTGTTVALRTSVSLSAGDVVYLVVSSTVALAQALHTDLGGTHLFACRVGSPSGSVSLIKPTTGTGSEVVVA